MQELKRSDEKYIEIENFKDYELTPCIAYEMAIRNETVISTIKNFMKAYDATYKDGNINDDELINKCRAIELVGRQFGFDFSDSIDDTGEMFIFYSNGGDFFNPKRKEINVDFIDRTGITQEINSFFARDFLLSTPEYHDMVEKNIEENSKILSLCKDGRFNAKYEAKLSYARPKLIFDEEKDVSFEFNFDLPVDELKLQLEEIYKNFKKQKEFLIHPLKTLVCDLQDADYILNHKGTTFDPRRILTKQQRVADMFYIYDAFKAGMRQSKIKMQIAYYYDKETAIEERTINKYYAIAKDYIDNFRYKELITGSKFNLHETIKKLESMGIIFGKPGNNNHKENQ